jgi:endonuclease/exonuclease/phosphatase (EEP) superfamily protein YafD
LVILTGSFVAFAAALSLRSKTFIAAGLILTIVNAYPVSLYYRKPAIEAPGRNQPLKLMLANVMVGNTRYADLLSLVEAEKPDVLVLQEYTPEWQRNTAVLQTEFPYNLGVAKQGGAGIALFSRFPTKDIHVVDFDASAHDGILAVIDVNGAAVTLLTIHPLTPMRNDKFASRNYELQESARILRQQSKPKIMIGDLNTSIWSPYFRDLTRDAGMRDARLGYGALGSWPSPLPAFLRLPIDNCLVSEDICVEDLRLGPQIGSDHLPLIVELTVPANN